MNSFDRNSVFHFLRLRLPLYLRPWITECPEIYMPEHSQLTGADNVHNLFI